MEKQAQLNALLYNKDADAAQIGNLQKEIFQLRQQIWEKAQAAGIPCPGGKGGCGMGMGMGMGMGRGMCAAL
jgi:membrane protease subunit (stomatin/prohibitin family)